MTDVRDPRPFSILLVAATTDCWLRYYNCCWLLAAGSCSCAVYTAVVDAVAVVARASQMH